MSKGSWFDSPGAVAPATKVLFAALVRYGCVVALLPVPAPSERRSAGPLQRRRDRAEALRGLKELDAFLRAGSSGA